MREADYRSEVKDMHETKAAGEKEKQSWSWRKKKVNNKNQLLELRKPADTPKEGSAVSLHECITMCF